MTYSSRFINSLQPYELVSSNFFVLYSSLAKCTSFCFTICVVILSQIYCHLEAEVHTEQWPATFWYILPNCWLWHGWNTSPLLDWSLWHLHWVDGGCHSIVVVVITDIIIITNTGRHWMMLHLFLLLLFKYTVPDGKWPLSLFAKTGHSKTVVLFIIVDQHHSFPFWDHYKVQNWRKSQLAEYLL